MDGAIHPSDQPRPFLVEGGNRNGRSDVCYEFGSYRLDPDERTLTRQGDRVTLTPKAFDTLLVLVRHAGHALKKKELLEQVWPDTFVDENNLSQQISLLRRALGEGEDASDCIETVPKLGYRFVPEVREVARNGSSERATTSRPGPFPREPDLDDVGGHAAQAATGPTWPHVEGELPAATTRRSSRRAFPLAAIGVAVATGALIAGVLLTRLIPGREPAESPASLKLIRLTTDGKAQNAAISPDGKYVAYVSGDPGNQSLWLRQVATHRDIQIVPPSQTAWGGLTFSHDGNFLYYIARRFESEDFRVYRVAVLGGEPVALTSRVLTPASLSPDDRWMVYSKPSDRVSGLALYIAKSDGEGERQFSSTRRDFQGLATPAWSPDGKLIAAAIWSTVSGTKRLGVWVFQVGSGRGSPLGSQNWTNLDSLAWLSDSKHLVMTASETSSGPAGQVWQLSYPGGRYRRITNDLTDYGDVSVTADSSTLAAIGEEVPSNVWVSPAAHPDAGRQITSGSVGFGGWSDLAWTADGKLVYYTVAGGNQELWIMEADGNQARRITSGPGWKLQPAPCPDGRTIVFNVISGASSNLWRVDPDGSNTKQLTFSDDTEGPVCSADGKWVIFSAAGGKLHKISVDGGSETELTSFPASFAAVSPDGKRIACVYFPELEKTAIGILSFEGGSISKSIPFDRASLPVSAAGRMQWTPDGTEIAYVENRGGVSNLWSQPLDGSAARSLTNFSSGQIFSFAWSPDGQKLALTRGTISSDVILIRDYPR